MTETIWTIVIVGAALLLLIAVAPTLIGYVVRRGATPWKLSRMQKAIDDSAERMGFEVGPGGDSMEGIRRGRKIRVHLEKEANAGRRHDEHRFVATRVTVSLVHEAWQSGVKIEPRGVLAKFENDLIGDLAELEDGPDIAIGDPEFDSEFIVGGRLEDDLSSRLARPEVQRALRQTKNKVAWFQIRLGDLIAEIEDGIGNEDELVRLVDRVVDSADALDDALAGADIGDDEVQGLFPDLPSETTQI